LRDNGIVASVGHSHAREEEAIEGVGAGATHATHLFNAMRRSGRLSQSVTGACLTDNRITAEAILDLVHVPASLLRLLAALKSPDKIVAITDSVRASVDRGIRRSRGAYRFGDGRLAGSCLTMIKAVENAVGVCGFSVTEAVSCAAENPARFLGEWHRIGSIAEGKDADIAIFNRSFVVLDTIIRGDHVWHNRIRRK
jgi:N-acetylglucosamine-6-phosphate deacetylase